MLTRMTKEDWAVLWDVSRSGRSRRGDKGRNDRLFLEALHYFAVHNITWRALPAACGNWNSIWMVDSQTTNSALSATFSYLGGGGPPPGAGRPAPPQLKLLLPRDLALAEWI